MKKPKSDDSAAKAIQERYARVLGLDQFPPPDAPKKSAAGKYLLCWVALASVVIGAWFFFRPASVDTAPPPAITSSAALQQPPSASASPGSSVKSEHGARESVAPESRESDQAVERESASYAKSNESGGAQRLQSLSGPQLPGNSESSVQQAPAPSFVVLLSTPSKDKAIERARELGNSGNPAEVILSSSGYYGVVLRRDTYEQAQAAMKAIAASGVVSMTPYIMSAARVKEYIYPETQKEAGKK